MSEVTVIIPAYNAAEYIRAAVNSALEQPGVSEVIVCDDGSSDATRDVVRKLEEPVRLLDLPRSGNPAVARNVGIQSARTDFVAFLDADDAWCAGKLQAQLAEISRAPQAAFVSTDAYRQTSGSADVLGRLIEDESPVVEPSLEQLVMRNFVITSSVLARRDALLEVGMFCESEAVRGAEDYDLWLRLAARYSFCYMPQPWVIYRDSRVSYRSRVGTRVTTQSILNVLDRLEDVLPDPSSALRRSLRMRRAQLYKELAREQWAAGEWPAALFSAAHCVCRDPGCLAGLRRWPHRDSIA